MTHLLHRKVADCIEFLIANDPSLSIIKDPACGGSTNIPFFLSDEIGNDTEITNVDFIVVKNDTTIRLVCEIEESDITPIRSFGKVFTIAISKFYKLKQVKKCELDQQAIFLQVLSSAKLKAKSKKQKQGQKASQAINAFLQTCKSTWINEYHLIYGNVSEFDVKNGSKLNDLQKIVSRL